MGELWIGHAASIFMGFFAIMNPIANTPVFLGLTALLGAAFLGGQAYEFASLAADGITLSSSIFGSSFFTLTGFHGLHVLIGVVWALLTLGKAARGRYSAEDNVGVEAFGLYWHFVDVVWIVLFTIIYLI